MSAGRIRTAWPVFPGPVFRRELGEAARGRRLYLLRALAAGGLAAYVGSNIGLRGVLAGARDLSPGQVAELATRAFRVFASSQFVMVLAMVPLLVAGSVADEKARGTLGLLLACRLSSLEIIADKLAARMWMVLVLMVAALPVLALIGLVGGIDPTELMIFYGMTLSTAWFVASLSMLVSVHARSASGAIVGAYAAMLAWVVLPVWSVSWLGTAGPPGFVDWLRPIAREVARSSPLSFLYPMEVWGRRVMGPFGRVRMTEEMASLQAAGGLILFILAAWRLRPAYRARVGGRKAGRLGWLSRALGLRGRSRPPCGNDPIAWKERSAPESAWLARLVLLVVLSFVARATIFDMQHNQAHRDLAFDEMFTYGFDLGEWGLHGHARTGMNYVLCEKAGLLYFAAMVAAAILAASGVAGERARGTWASLLSTPLDRRSILRAKMLAAAWTVRVPLGLLVFFYLASLASTAMHPIGFVVGIAAVASFVWFAVALGTYVSLRSRDANRAIGRTALILAAVDLGPAAILYPLIGDSAKMITTPVLAVELPMSRMRFQMFAEAIRVEPVAGVALLVALGVVLAHAIAAWLLTRAATRRIERDAG